MKHVVICIDDGIEMKEISRVPIGETEELVSESLYNPDVSRETITKFLTSVGIPSNIEGKQYLVEAIHRTIFECRTIPTTKELYPHVAYVCSTSPTRVERAIRYAIEKCCKNNPSKISSVFGGTVNPVKGKLTNAEFINQSAEYLSMRR